MSGKRRRTPAPASPAAALEAFADASTDRLQRALNAALRRLEEQRLSKAELVAAVHQAASEASAALKLPAVPRPVPDRRSGTPEVAVAVLADWQLAKRTPTYSTDVCERRIELYASKVIELARIQRAHHPVRECRVYVLGDIVEGEQIFPGQAWLVDASLFRQVLVDGPRILGGFLRQMLSEFDRVHVVGVIGNHGAIGGRSRRESHPETNADAMVYEVTRGRLEAETRLTWAPTWTPGERHWYAVDRIGEKGFFLFHGDQVKGGFAGFPWYGFANKVKGWRMGAVAEPFDYALAGHFHTPTRMLIGRVKLWVSGSPESSNTYAAERLAAQGTPSQWLLFAHPSRGVTAEYEVDLDARA